MTSKYSKSFTTIGAITGEPVTILVEYIEADGYKGVSIESVEGEYNSPEEFEKACKQVLNSTNGDETKIYNNFLPMTIPDAQRLVDTLNEAISASKETARLSE